MDTAGFLAVRCLGECETEFLEVRWFSEVFRAPVAPVAEGVAAGEEGSTGRGAD